MMQADIPTFELVDLPGIQAYPAEQERATTQLVSTYLNAPNTLVLCVVEATTAAFDSSVALKLIREAGKLSNTILAMTKSDLVSTEEEYVPKIFDRILGESSDNQHLQELAGCVAIANRTDSSVYSSAGADAAEREVFAKMLHNPAEAFSAPEVQRQLRQNMTIKQLIVQLDRMFHRYIVEEWKPAALEKVETLQQAALASLESLGPPVEDLDANDVFHIVLEHVSTDLDIIAPANVLGAVWLLATKYLCVSRQQCF